MLSKNVLYYGKEEPLPTRVSLHAGPLTLVYEDGDVRYIKLGDAEILRRIYVAVRDRNWGTILPVYSNIQMDIGEDSFLIGYDVENTQNEIDLAWHGEIKGDANGTLTFSMEGTARAAFMKNRIGFCVLHPSTAAGAACVIEHVDGTTERAPLPRRINPDQPVLPFAELRRLTHEVLPGVWADVEMTGDIFELEDQRNWTDASFKTFCTPLRLPYPVQVEAGTRIEQTITVRIEDGGRRTEDEGRTTNDNQSGPLTLTVDPDAAKQSLPRIGLGKASHGRAMDERERVRLTALHLDHLRVDLTFAEDGYVDQLRRANDEANALDVLLHIALLLSDDAERELGQLKAVLGEVQPRVGMWLIYPRRENYNGGSPTARLVELARHELAQFGGKFAAGSNTDFIFFQRNAPPPIQLLDAVTLQINPQLHAFDNASLIETLQGQAAVAETARQWAENLPVMVSPITLKPRFNAYTTAAPPPVPPGELPPQVDPRQMSLFGAGWTMGSIKYLAESGVSSLTFYETTGWRGVMETETGSPVPDKFRSFPGGVFPLYYVLADVGEFAGGAVVPSRSSDPLTANGIFIEKDSRRRVLVANLTAELHKVIVQNLGTRATVRVLDETNVEHAMQSPEAFRAKVGQTVDTQDGALELTLLPFAVARIDCER